jgi:exonuclease SbcC
LAQAAGRETPETLNRQWLAEIQHDAKKAFNEAKIVEKNARLERTEAERVAQERRSAADRVRRVRTAQEKLAVLAQQESLRVQRKEDLLQAQRAAPMVELADQLEMLSARLAEAEHQEQSQLRECQSVSDLQVDISLAELRERIGHLREEAGTLIGLVHSEQQHKLDQTRIDKLSQKIPEFDKRKKLIAHQLAAIPSQLTELTAELENSVEAAAKLDGVRQRETELEIVVKDALSLPAMQERVRVADDMLRSATDDHLRAKSYCLELRELRLTGMAAELASRLCVGESCPVCGSMDHPAPARPAENTVGREQEVVARQAETAAEEVRQKMHDQQQEARLALAGLHERLHGRTADLLQEELKEVRAGLSALVELAERKDRLFEQSRFLEKDQIELTRQLHETENSRTAIETELRGLTEQMAERAQKLEAARGDYADVETRRSSLLAVVNAWERLAENKATVAAVARQREEQQQALQKSLSRNGFTEIEQARRAVVSDDVLAEWERWLSDIEVSRATQQAVLAEPELQDVSPNQEVDVDTALAELERARDQAEVAAATLLEATRAEQELVELSEALNANVARMAPKEEAFAELDAVTDVVNGRGQNSRKMSLRSYVLAARLEEVALAATARLGTMSQGRYSFVHSDASGARGTRGGLGLDVLDDYSGMIRSTKTLSGGESFLASLALALGLADVVASETGGALLDTLFIDEGFGTLDAETLDVVMNVLDDLRANGRVVGLVSHVEELRQRIPTRLKVRKSRSGSTVEVHSG